MEFNIALIRGDGIGPEIVSAAVMALDKIAELYGHSFKYREALLGGCAYDKYGVPMPDETVEICLSSNAVLLGAVGGPKWDALAPNLRPEAGLLAIRKALGLYANLRPATLFDCLADASPLKNSRVKNTDIMLVRELTGGIYFGERGRNGDTAYDTESYSKHEIERIMIKAFELAKVRRKSVTSVDKANVLASSKLWREVAESVSANYPDVALRHMYVDNAAMQLASAPADFDVIVTSNMFGDILSDLASACVGSIGMLPSASLADGNFGLYEPVHGSAPELAGCDSANPIATILSAAMLLRTSLGLSGEASALENAMSRVLELGFRTIDIASDDCKTVGCHEMAELICANIG